MLNTKKNGRSKVVSVLRRIKYGRVAAVLGAVAVIGFSTYKIADMTDSNASAKVEALEAEPIPVYTYTVNDEPEIIKSGEMRCMVYTGGDVTYTGVEPYIGCVAGSKELLGKSCYLYEVKSDGTKGRFIGRFKFDDTGYGVDGNIESGDAICVYRNSLGACDEWIDTYGDNVFIEVIKG